MCEISQGCAFWGFGQKMVTPPPLAPKIVTGGWRKQEGGRSSLISYGLAGAAGAPFSNI